MGIQRLSASVVSSLRTDVTVTTSAQCVTELVLNSIDAGATAIAVRVDLNNYRIQVIDNGHGVSQSDMLVVGTRYMTSKCHSLQDLQSHLSHFGFRGEALASISDVCGTLTIVSRHESSSATLCKIFIKGVPNKVGKSRQPRACCGTTITVSDFLYNRPVRRARIKSAIDLEDIKTHIECIALINFQISFSLRNDANNEMILQTQRVSDIPTMFGSLFGSPSAKNLMPVKEIMGPFKVEGYISNEAHYLKKFQFIYVNQRLLLKTKLHKLVNSVLSRSTFLKSNNVPHVPISKEINHNVFLAFSPPKRDKHAVFVLNIICPLSEYDITMDPKKTLIEFCDWDSLLNCFENLLRKFVEQEAAVYSENDNVLGGEPTRKLQTVIDEINQLARDEVLQRQITLSSQETINVRAVHSIPVRRDQVSFSPDLSLDIQSTATSNLSSCAKNNSASQFTAIPSSTFTEKPYPPLPCNDSYEKSCTSREDKRDPFMTDEENLPVAKKLSKVQSSNEPKSLAEGLQNSSNYKKKSVKGFITNTLHFVGKSGSMHDDLLYERTHDFKGSAEVSPINALASIKEIRRKKLLQNLNKFSFNPVCEKPLLHKTRRSAVATKTKVDQSCPNLKHEDMRNKSNNFKAVQKLDVKQNNFNATASRESWDMISQLGTTQSSAKTITTLIENEILAKTSEELVSSKQLATKHCEVEPPLDDFKELKKLDKHDSINITTKEEFVKCSGLLHKCHVGLSNTVAKTETRRVLSVEDMIMTRYKKGSDDASEIFSSENVEDNYSKITEWVPRTQILSGNRLNAITEDTCVNSHTSKSLKIHYPDATKFSKLLSVSEETCCKPTYPSLESVSDSRNQTVRREIVDYDSSPSSSQEESVNDDVSLMNVSSCSNELKRKNGCPGKQEDSKKARTSPGNVSACDQCTLQMLGLQDPNTKSDYIFGSLNRDCHSSLITPKDGWKEHCPPKTDGVFSGTEPVCKTSELLKLSKPQNIIEDSDFSSLEDHHSVSFTVKDNTNQIAQGAADQSTTSPSENLNLDRHFINNTVAEDALPDSRAPASKDSSTASLCAGSDLQDLTFEKNCQALEDNWIKKLNESGRPFYIHKKSGMTSFQEPSEGICNFKFSDRLLFLPKGMSPLLMNKVTNEACTSPNIASFKVKEDLYAVKWAPNEMTDESGSRPLVDKLLSESDRFLAKTFPESQVKNAAMQDNSQSDIKVYNVMHPHSFTKDIFRNLQVLGQLDKKFIVVLASVESTKEVVMLFDQHAVHERIRVESLTEEYRQKDGTSIWRSAPVEPALPLQLSAIEVRILQSYKSKMENLGFSFNVVDLNTINILRVPTCLLLRENREVGRGVSVLRQHLESLIREQVESLLDTRGVGTDHPTIIRNVISSEACRGAVKFGHYLTVADCQAFLHNLSVCNLPFQCAHGRPSLMPIVDLSMLKSKVPRKRPNLQKLKKLQQSI